MIFSKIIFFLKYFRYQFFGTKVNISDCKNPMGFSYDPNGFHFLIKTLSIYVEKDYDYALKYLINFYNNFRPKDSSFLNITKGMASSFIINDPFQFPWGNFSKNKIIKKKNIKTARICGPKTNQFAENELKSLIELYSSIKENGFKYSFISGSFLIKSNVKKFIVLQGNHRLAVLSYLGYKKIKVFKLKTDKNILYHNLQAYGYVKENKCDIATAKIYFNNLFNSDGKSLKNYYEL